MKKALIVIIILVLSLSIVSCSNNLSPEDEAKKVAIEYMNTYYSIEDFTKDTIEVKLPKNNKALEPIIIDEKLDKLKPIITDEMENYILRNRGTLMIENAAKNLERNISVEEINLEMLEYSKDNTESTIHFDYTMKLKFSAADNEEEIEELVGQIKLTLVNNKWKVALEKPYTYGRLMP